ncbi:hypothetical protein LN042_33655 [Kitasatospora sp. RB6PN24]|nr:hypothetical protein [Kitasatospora humi]MCC9311951.1 hypothetical protein [Kitasatospora humi]
MALLTVGVGTPDLEGAVVQQRHAVEATREDGDGVGEADHVAGVEVVRAGDRGAVAELPIEVLPPCLGGTVVQQCQAVADPAGDAADAVLRRLELPHSDERPVRHGRAAEPWQRSTDHPAGHHRQILPSVVSRGMTLLVERGLVLRKGYRYRLHPAVAGYSSELEMQAAMARAAREGVPPILIPDYQAAPP